MDNQLQTKISDQVHILTYFGHIIWLAFLTITATLVWVPILEYLTNVHWIIGVLFFLLYFFLVAYAYVDIVVRGSGARRQSEMAKTILANQPNTLLFRVIIPTSPFLVATDCIVITSWFAVLLCSWVSWVLSIKHLAVYGSELDPSLMNYTLFYLWLFVDLIPALEIWQTLNIKIPFIAKNWVAGLPILIFKVIVIAGIFSAARRWWRES